MITGRDPKGFLGGTSGKEPACQCRRLKPVQSLGWQDALEESMATHSSILAWRIPWTAEPGRSQSMGLQRVGHNWSDLAYTHTETPNTSLKILLLVKKILSVLMFVLDKLQNVQWSKWSTDFIRSVSTS